MLLQTCCGATKGLKTLDTETKLHTGHLMHASQCELTVVYLGKQYQRRVAIMVVIKERKQFLHHEKS